MFFKQIFWWNGFVHVKKNTKIKFLYQFSFEQQWLNLFFIRILKPREHSQQGITVLLRREKDESDKISGNHRDT